MLRVDQLSERQRRVLDGIAAGKSNAVIADEIGMTLDGVKWHVSELLGEAGLASRQELADWWQRETAPKAAPAFWPLRILSHPVVGAAARIAVVFAVVAAIAAGIVIVATREKHTAVVIMPAAPEKLAYVQDGDVWVKHLPDGAAVQITHRAAGEPEFSAPKWSPSGQWLTFIQQGDPWIVRADGTGLRRLDAIPGWSPVADRYVGIDSGTTSDGFITIFTENADGSNRQVVVKYFPSNGHLTTQVRDLLWSPDGRWLAYTILGQGIPEMPERRASVGLVSADGGTPLIIYDTGEPSQDDVRLVGWSPDGRALFFVLDPSFSASALADGLPLQALLVLPAGQPGPAPSPEPRPFAPRSATMLLNEQWWDRQSARSAIAVTDGSGRETWTNKRIAIVSWGAGTVTDLTPPDVAAMEPAWSPDGTRIAYVAAPDAPGVPGGDAAKAAMAKRKIWVMDANGSNQRKLTNDPAYRDEYPRWSADGSRICFIRLDAQNRWSLWIMASDGSGERELISGMSAPFEKGAPMWWGYYGLIGWSGVLDYWPATAH